jgi:hypothetical protein
MRLFRSNQDGIENEIIFRAFVSFFRNYGFRLEKFRVDIFNFKRLHEYVTNPNEFNSQEFKEMAKSMGADDLVLDKIDKQVRDEKYDFILVKIDEITCAEK